VVREVTEIIREFQPEVVVTFDPIGGYRHPDHVFIHEVTKKAFFQAGDPDYETDSQSFQAEKLYYHTISKRYLRIVVRLLRLLGQDPTKWGKNDDIDLAALAEEEFPVHARIDVLSMEKRKKAASACHASQSGSSLVGDFIRWGLRMLGFRGKDLYMRAYPDPLEGEVEHDLFAGL
jgi:LmbE family N-acetylglucosaminyl deacetylase